MVGAKPYVPSPSALLHGAADLMIGLRDRLGVEVAAQLAEHHVVAGPLEIGHDDFCRVGIRGGACEPELLGGPQAEHLIAACPRLEPDFLFVRELELESFLRACRTCSCDASCDLRRLSRLRRSLA
jgi:hypothetical protein